MGIVLENVCKSFKRKEVLHQISLELNQGIYGLLGPNGAGKTTLMRCLVGLHKVNAGEICIDEDIKKEESAIFHKASGFMEI